MCLSGDRFPKVFSCRAVGEIDYGLKKIMKKKENRYRAEVARAIPCRPVLKSPQGSPEIRKACSPLEQSVANISAAVRMPEAEKQAVSLLSHSTALQTPYAHNHAKLTPHKPFQAPLP